MLNPSFCRVSAVFGGVYMLGRPIASLRYSEDGMAKAATISFAEDEAYTADCVVSASGSDIKNDALAQHKAIIILSQPVRLPKVTPGAEDDEEPEITNAICENALLIIPPGTLGDNLPAAPIMTLMAGEGSFSAPSGQCESEH